MQLTFINSYRIPFFCQHTPMRDLQLTVRDTNVMCKQPVKVMLYINCRNIVCYRAVSYRNGFITRSYIYEKVFYLF